MPLMFRQDNEPRSVATHGFTSGIYAPLAAAIKKC